ncbi:hypothetical protein ACFXKY_40270 [Streptomyces canus]|uniref:hypothetical protein n=1 Tax=Streptomyces canus TaxID=58343 RepID=UPI00369DBFAA
MQAKGDLTLFSGGQADTGESLQLGYCAGELGDRVRCVELDDLGAGEVAGVADQAADLDLAVALVRALLILTNREVAR